MKLYGALASPYVARVILFAQIKGIDLAQAEIPGAGLTAYWSKIATYKCHNLFLYDGLVPKVSAKALSTSAR